MKTKVLIISIQTLILATTLSSCISYNHSYRLLDDASKESRTFEVKDNSVVDLDIDFSSRIKTTSSSEHKGVGQVQKAKEDAYYQAITQAGIDVLVNPVYQIKTVKSIFGSKSTAVVSGYKGMYGKVTKVEGGNGLNAFSQTISDEDQLFEMRFTNLKKLSTINDIAHEEKTIYAIDSKEGCFNGSKSTDGFGNLHLLETTKNKKSLVDQYMKIVNEEKIAKSSIETSFSLLGRSKSNVVNKIKAQSYKGAIGFRGSAGLGSIFRLSGKYFLQQEKAAEFIVSRGNVLNLKNINHWSVTGLYEFQKPFHKNKRISSLSYYYGFGAHFAHYDFYDISTVTYGPNVVLGLEYNIPKIPFTISLDNMFTWAVISNDTLTDELGSSWILPDAGLSIRYYIK
jgi:hypothetical protein